MNISIFLNLEVNALGLSFSCSLFEATENGIFTEKRAFSDQGLWLARHSFMGHDLEDFMICTT
jgi:hypothetical protein